MYSGENKDGYKREDMQKVCAEKFEDSKNVHSNFGNRTIKHGNLEAIISENSKNRNS